MANFIVEDNYKHSVCAATEIVAQQMDKIAEIA